MSYLRRLVDGINAGYEEDGIEDRILIVPFFSESGLEEMIELIPPRMLAVGVTLHGNLKGSVWIGSDRDILVPLARLQSILNLAPSSTAVNYFACVNETQNAVDAIRFVKKGIEKNASK